ncbi:MAG TPA: DUF4404 family protein [Steroidobacteraceae bacterium]|nr:DUF4404 family protein [Steroidobacteraceae bacterium]
MNPAGNSSPLEQSLAQLHADLAGAAQVDEHTRQLLRSLLGDIERLLREGETPGGAQVPHRLEALAVGFEADHPTLAANLRQFIDLLGRAGL